MATRIISILSGGDDADYFDGEFSNSRQWSWLGSDATEGLGSWSAFRFQFPDDIDISSITDIRLKLSANNSSDFECFIRIELMPASAWVDTPEGSPKERYEAVPPKGQTYWTGYAEAGEVVASPDISSRIKLAMTNMSQGDYIGVICGANPDAPSTKMLQIASFENSLYVEPQLEITYEPKPKFEAMVELDVNYHNGEGSDSGRRCDIYIPEGAPPEPVGLPCVIWLHGGSWQSGSGSRSDLPLGFKDLVLSKGYAFVNASYKLSESDIFLSNTGFSFPDPVLDVRTLVNFIVDNAGSYRIDPSRLIITGHSAGGHVALWAALSHGDSSNYDGYQNLDNNRSSTPGNSRPAFDLDKNIITPPFAGVFAWTSPVDVWQTTQHSNGVQAASNNLARTGYMGERQFTNPPLGDDELDLSKYISGTSNVYSSATREPTIPIGYVMVKDDPVLEQSAGVDSLYDALGTSGFTYERPPVGVLSSSGLTRFELNTSHEAVMSNYLSWELFGDWLDEVVSAPPITLPWVPQMIISP